MLEFPEIIIPALPDVPIAENKMILDMSEDIIPHLNVYSILDFQLEVP